MDKLYVVRFGLRGEDSSTARPSEADEDEQPDVKTTFAHFGLAYYHASVLEHELVNILAVSRVIKAREDAERLLQDPWDEKFKATMGALIKELLRQSVGDATLADDLLEALRLRNHLAHAFWRENAETFLTEDGRSRMIVYLTAAQRYFEQVDKRLTGTLGVDSLAQLGVTASVVEAWYNDTVARIDKGESEMPKEMADFTRESLLAKLRPASRPSSQEH